MLTFSLILYRNIALSHHKEVAGLVFTVLQSEQYFSIQTNETVKVTNAANTQRTRLKLVKNKNKFRKL